MLQELDEKRIHIEIIRVVSIISRLERELARDVKVHIVNGMSGELAAVVRGPSKSQHVDCSLGFGDINLEETRISGEFMTIFHEH